MDHSLSAANESADERAPDSDPDGDEAQLSRHTDGHEGYEPDGPETAPGAEAYHRTQGVHHTDSISFPSSLPLPDSLPRADAPPPNPYQCTTPSATRCNPNQQRGTGITNPITTNTPTHDCNDHERQEIIDNETHDNEAAAAEDYHIHEHGHCATEADVIPPPSSTAPTVFGGAATTSTAVVAAAADATADATSTTMTTTPMPLPLPLASDIANHHDGDFASAVQ
ncbi:hypothetical protein KEM56_005075, partial [Ascosphaera pollenicola]